jgi:hypothetical protein
MVGIALGGPSGVCGCGGCLCCEVAPSSFSLDHAAGWGTTSGGLCNGSTDLCVQIGSTVFVPPIALTFRVPPFTISWPDEIYGSIGGPDADDYIKSEFRACNLVRQTYTSGSCQMSILAGFYRDPEEEGCRLVIAYVQGNGSSTYIGQPYGVYRSPVITDCCAEVTLDLYTSGLCSSPPSTITISPVCPDGEEEEA